MQAGFLKTRLFSDRELVEHRIAFAATHLAIIMGLAIVAGYGTFHTATASLWALAAGLGLPIAGGLVFFPYWNKNPRLFFCILSLCQVAAGAFVAYAVRDMEIAYATHVLFGVILVQSFFTTSSRFSSVLMVTIIVALLPSLWFGAVGRQPLALLTFVTAYGLSFTAALVVASSFGKARLRSLERSSVMDKAYRELRGLERARSEFLSSVTHELKTPLVTVRGYLDLALRQPLSAGVAHGLKVAQRSSKRLQRLIDELLVAADPSRISTDLDSDQVALRSVIEEELAALSGMADARQVVLVQIEDKGSDIVWADRERVGQVVSNLISNAIKHSPRGGVVEVGAEAHSNVDRVLWVRDQGQGIPPEQMQHLFEENYMRNNDHETMGTKGLGLGLVICKRLVTAMGGRIWVDSHLGMGTTFSVTFPVRAPVVNEKTMTKPAKLRALILDDEPDVLALAEFHLQAAGYETTLFQNGLAAYEAAMQDEFDILLLDVNVPGLTGVEVSRRLREAGRPGRILLFSALIRDDAERLLSEARADGFLPKPFDVDEIEAKVAPLGRR